MSVVPRFLFVFLLSVTLGFSATGANSPATMAPSQPSQSPSVSDPLGPDGGLILNLAIAPSNSAIMYAGTRNGVFKSSDAGMTWDLSNVGIPRDWHIAELTVDPSDPNRVYAIAGNGDEESVLHGSTNGGNSWAVKRPNVRGMLVSHPTTPNVLYLLNNNTDVLNSVDYGTTWTTVYSMVGYSISSIVIDPITPTTIYLTTKEGLYKSLDNGATWNKIPSNFNPRNLVIHPTNHSILYGSAFGEDRDVYKSIDGGQTWNLIAAIDLTVPIG